MIRCKASPDILYVRGSLERGCRILVKVEEAQECETIRFVFSLGSRKNHLTNAERAAKIRARISYGWYTQKTLQKENGRLIWEAGRKCENARPGQEELWVEFGGILPLDTGITYMEVWDGERKVWQLPLWKKENEVGILYFEPREGTVRQGETTRLYWETRGAVKCLLQPGNIEVPATGSRQVVIRENSSFQLEAFRADRKAVAQTKVYLYEKSLSNYYRAEPDTYYKGSMSALFWKNEDTENKKWKITTPFQQFSAENYKQGQKIVTGKEVLLEFSDDQGNPYTKALVSMKPDQTEGILDYIVTEDIEKPGTFFLRWDTAGGKRMQLFAMVFEQRALLWQMKKQAWIAGEQDCGTASYMEEEWNPGLRHCFILRVLNKAGDWKQSVYWFCGGKQEGYYDNLGK